VLVEKMRTGLGDQVMEAVERIVLLSTSNDITRAAVDHGHVSGPMGGGGGGSGLLHDGARQLGAG
jgi:hypothetical protein